MTTFEAKLSNITVPIAGIFCYSGSDYLSVDAHTVFKSIDRNVLRNVTIDHQNTYIEVTTEEYNYLVSSGNWLKMFKEV